MGVGVVVVEGVVVVLVVVGKLDGIALKAMARCADRVLPILPAKLNSMPSARPIRARRSRSWRTRSCLSWSLRSRSESAAEELEVEASFWIARSSQDIPRAGAVGSR